MRIIHLLVWLLALGATPLLAQTTAAVEPRLSEIALSSGHTLPLRTWHPTQPTQMVVVGIHGFNDYSGAFQALADHLVEAHQATIYAYDQQSFGANPNRGLWPGKQVLVDNLIEVVQHIRAQHPSLPVVLVGESMGGALVHMALAQAGPTVADKVLLLAPAVWGLNHMPGFMSTSIQHLNIWAPNLQLSHFGARSLGIRPSDDPQVIRQINTDPLFNQRTAVNSLYGVATLMEDAFRTPLQSTVPTLVMYGLQDKIIPPRAVCRWLRHQATIAPHTATQFYIYPQGWHMLTRQTQATAVLDDIQQWLKSGRAARPTTPSLDLPQAIERVC